MATSVKTVKQVEQKVAGNGKAYWTVQWTDGSFDNIFDDALYVTICQAAETGAALTVTKIQNPKNTKYWNVTGLTLGGEPTGAVPPAPAATAVKIPAQAPPPLTPTPRETSIEAQSDMKAAVELLRMVPWPPATKVSTILKVLPITYEIIKRTRTGDLTPADEDVLAVLLAEPKAKEAKS